MSSKINVPTDIIVKRKIVVKYDVSRSAIKIIITMFKGHTIINGKKKMKIPFENFLKFLLSGSSGFEQNIITSAK